MPRRLSIPAACLALLLLLGSTLSASATWPNLVNYQGQLTDSSGNAVSDGSYGVTFRIYTVSTAGSAIWTEAQTVTVSKGLFNAILGSTTGPGLSTLTPAQINGDLWLGITVGADAEMTPRQQLLGPLNANNAEFVGGLSPNNQPNNLVVLDGTGKIPAGLIQGGSIQFPLAMSGSSTYGLSVVNSSASSSALGLSVVASSGIQSFATDPAGSGVLGSTGAATGSGVLGLNSNGANTAVGVEGLGVIGVQGQATQNNGRGVEGDVSATVSGAIGVFGTNNFVAGTAVVGSHRGTGAGMGVRGQSASGQGAIGVYGVVSGTGGSQGAVGVEGFTTQSDGTAVAGQQGNPSGAAYPYAGVHGFTAGLGLGIGVLGEGNQGVYGNSTGLCGVCAVNANASAGAGLSASSPLTAIQAASTGTSGPTFGLSLTNASPNGTGVMSTGGHTGVQVQSLGGGTNFFSDGSKSPAFGFTHTDNSNPGGGVGVYSAENCASCYGGEFVNTAATNGGTQGAALFVNGRLNVGVAGQLNGPAGTFTAPGAATSYTLTDPYITASSLVFLTVATATGSVAAVTSVADGSATITFTPALAGNTTYQFLIIGQ
jgi:hypothetical protein